MSIDVGHLVSGKYELVRLLGRGSMGEVWIAHHRTLSDKVALKLLTAGDDLEDEAHAVARFQNEAQVAARLSRKTRHIVRVTDHGEEEGAPYLVMELLEGKTLESVLENFGRVPPATAATIVSQVARALTVAHGDGVMHRDLKPANIFLSRDEDGAILVKLLDFGIARVIHGHRVPSEFSTAKGLIFGTPSYMSPEQALGSPQLDHRCDLWALATIAYECITGMLPVDGEGVEAMLRNLCAGRIVPILKRNPDLPVALDVLFRKAFAELPQDRFESAAAFAKAFARAVPSEEAVQSTGPRTAGSLPPPAMDEELRLGMLALRRRARARVAVAAICGGAALLAGAGIAWRIWSKPASAAATPVPTVAATSAGVAAVPPPQPSPSPADRTPIPSVAVSSLPKTGGGSIAARAGAAPSPSSPEGPPRQPALGYTVVPPPTTTAPPAVPASTQAPAPATAPPANTAPAPTPSAKTDRSGVL